MPIDDTDMDPRAYDDDAFERRAAKRLCMWPLLLFFSTLIMAEGFRQYIGPFIEHYDYHSEKLTSAKSTLSMDSCRDPAKRVTLGSFDNCAAAQLVVSKYVIVQAFYSTIREHQLCPRGRCEWLGINWASTIWMLFVILIVLNLLGCVSGVVGGASSLYNVSVGRMMLPMSSQNRAYFKEQQLRLEPTS